MEVSLAYFVESATAALRYHLSSYIAADPDGTEILGALAAQFDTVFFKV
jgi:hypothetical protein